MVDLEIGMLECFPNLLAKNPKSEIKFKFSFQATYGILDNVFVRPAEDTKISTFGWNSAQIRKWGDTLKKLWPNEMIPRIICFVFPSLLLIAFTAHSCGLLASPTEPPETLVTGHKKDLFFFSIIANATTTITALHTHPPH